jgi:MSHA biogenesis protein MshI
LLSFFKKERANKLMAMVPQSEGICIVDASYTPGKPRLSICDFTPWNGNEHDKLLREKVKQYSLHKSPCSTLIDIGDYSIISVEAPDVPPTELRQAIRWRIKDLIDFHIDDAVVDVYDAPATGASGKQNNLYVVVTQQSTIQKQADLLHNVDANLDVIDIPELVMRNITALLPENDAGVALVYLARDRGLITITRQSTLYLARSLDIGYEQLGQQPAAAEELSFGDSLSTSGEDGGSTSPGMTMNPAYDRLVLELQRSLDYYDRYFGQPPIAGIYLAPTESELPGLNDYLHQNLAINTHNLDLNEHLECTTPLDPQTQAQCLLAIGAALRQEQTTL